MMPCRHSTGQQTLPAPSCPAWNKHPVFLSASQALFQHRVPSELCLVWEQQEEQQLSAVSRRFSEL